MASDEPATTNDPVVSNPPRAVLSLPKAINESGVRHWRREAGAPRPTDDLIALFAGKDIVQVIIRDPYAIARSTARQAQVQFISALCSASRSLAGVTIEYAPEAEGDVEDEVARRDFGASYARAFSDPPPKLLLSRRRKRSREDDFHDRFVDIDVRHAGGAIRRHEVTIGRGVEALFDLSKQCTMTYAPPPAAVA